jgi:predicted nucleotidyltransferase
MLFECAKALLSEDFSEHLDKYINTGESFPSARQRAVTDMLGEEFGHILSTPNNILGIEYIKAMLSCGIQNAEIKTVCRKGASHDSSECADNICSASALRDMLRSSTSTDAFIPEATAEILRKAMSEGKAPADYGRLETAILYRLRSMSVEDIRELPDVSEGLEYRIYDAVRLSASLDAILEKIKTKRYTHSRLRRIILYAFLGITRDDVQMPVPYIRVLGFNKRGAQLLKEAKEKANLPIVTKSSDIKSLGDDAKRCFELECRARDLFSLSLPDADICGREMTDKIIVL